MRIHEFPGIISDTWHAPSAFCCVPPECQIRDLFSHKCAQLTQFRYQSNILADTIWYTCEQVYFCLFPSSCRSLNDICNGLLRVCAYVVRRNALDNCYYLKLHLPPSFFTNFVINIRTMALLYADWNVYRQPMIFLCKNMQRIMEKNMIQAIAHTDRIHTRRIKLNDAAFVWNNEDLNCFIARTFNFDFLICSNKGLEIRWYILNW